MKSLFLLLALAAPASPQGLHFGLKAGVPATAYFHTGRMLTAQGGSDYSAATRRYTVGAFVEWRFTDPLGLEFDTLYKRMGVVRILTTSRGGISTRDASDSKGNSWDFYLTAKRRFGRRLKPYLAGGGALRYVGPIHAVGAHTVTDSLSGTVTRTPIDTHDLSYFRKRLYPGLTVAGGIEFGSSRLRFLPEARYTHWTANLSVEGGLLRFNPNQLEFLLGLSF